MNGVLEALQQVKDGLATRQPEAATHLGMVIDGLADSRDPFKSLVALSEQMEKQPLSEPQKHVQTAVNTFISPMLDKIMGDDGGDAEMSLAAKRNVFQSGVHNGIRMALDPHDVDPFVDPYLKLTDPDEIVDRLFGKKRRLKVDRNKIVRPEDLKSPYVGRSVSDMEDMAAEATVDELFGTNAQIFSRAL